MASVPAENTRYRALRRHASEMQRQANAAVLPGAVQAGQLPRMAAVHQDQGPPHAQHQLPLGASVRSQSPTGRLRNRRSMGSRGPYDEGAPALSLGELHRAGRGSAVERGPAVSGPPVNRAAVSWCGSGSVGRADPPLYDARPSSAASGRVDDGRGLLAGLRSERRPATTGAAGVRTGSLHDAPLTTGCHAPGTDEVTPSRREQIAAMQAQIQQLHAEASVELGSLRALRPRSAYSPYVPQPEAAAPLEEQPRAEAEEPWFAVDDETRIRELCGQLSDAAARLHDRGPQAPSAQSPHVPGSMEDRVWRINFEDAERRRLGELSSLAHLACAWRATGWRPC